MGTLFSKLRIGEKILLSTALIGLLFLGVIWQYQLTLDRGSSDYRQLLEVYGTRESSVRRIDAELWRARLTERQFLLTRDLELQQAVAGHVAALHRHTAELGKIDADTHAAGDIDALISAHQQRFDAIVTAWKTRGLDENSGMQGAFRDSVHQLQAEAATLNVDGLYLQLLQLRRAEKDLGLRREPQYRDKALTLIEQLGKAIDASSLGPPARAALQADLDAYRNTFPDYAQRVLAGDPIDGGKGPFRQAAHRIEDRLRSRYVPNLERDLLQLRRREKDYLLRHDPRYVQLAVDELEGISAKVAQSAISAEQKAKLQGLIEAYQRDFLALVAQDDLIATLLAEMDTSAQQVIPLVQATIDHAEKELRDNSERIRESSAARSSLMLWVVLAASLLGLFLAIAIARHISHRVVRMAGLLDQMAREQPAKRLPVVPGARNEVDAMAASVNAMADHKAHLLAWWKTSMAEADAAQALHEAVNDPDTDATDCQRAERALRQAIEEKEVLLDGLHRELRQQAETIADDSEGHTSLKAINSTARAMLGILEQVTAGGR